MMRIEPRGDVSRLAKWAQGYIHSLVLRISELEKRLDELSNVHPESNVMIGGRHDEPDIGLPPDSRIYFYATFPGEPQDRLTNMIEVHHDRDRPGTLYVASYGSSPLKICPSASNSFYLEMSKR